MKFTQTITLVFAFCIVVESAFAQRRSNDDEPTGPDPNSSGQLNSGSFGNSGFFSEPNTLLQPRIIQIGFSNQPISIQSPANADGVIRYQLIEATGVAYDYTINPGKTQTFKENSNWKLRLERENEQGSVVYQLHGNNEYQFIRLANGVLTLTNKTAADAASAQQGVGKGRVMLGFNGMMQPSGGMYVHDVNPGSIAEKIGLKAGDVVLTIDGRSFKSHQEYLQLLQNVGNQFHVQVRDTHSGRIVQHDIERE